MKYKITGEIAKRTRHPKAKIASHDFSVRLRRSEAIDGLALLPQSEISACAKPSMASEDYVVSLRL